VSDRNIYNTFYDVKRQRHCAQLASDDIGDDQRIKHSDNDRKGFDMGPFIIYWPTVPNVKFIAFI